MRFHILQDSPITCLSGCYIIAGGPGTGKTSLINYFFGTSLPVRVGGIRATN